MPAAFYILLGPSLVLASSLSAGALLFRVLDRRSSWPFVFVIGSAMVSLIVTLLALAGLIYKGVFLALALVLAGAAATTRSYRLLDRIRIGSRWFWAGYVPFTILYFVNAMAPEMSPDGMTYHLGLVARYYREHGMVPVPENFYASLSQGVEMLFLFSFAFGRHSAAALTHFLFLAFLPLMIADYCARRGWIAAGVCAALLVYATPVVGIDGISAYVDVALAAAWFSIFVLLAERDTRLAIPVGMLAGFCYGIKYTAFLSFFYAVWRWRKEPRALAVCSIAAAIFVLPWVLRNWIWIGNPVAPFFNGLFPNPWVTPVFESEYAAALRNYGLTGSWDWFVNIFIRGAKINGLLGPAWLLSPLGFGEAAVWFAAGAYPLNLDVRFLIPALPLLAVGIGKKLARWPRVAFALTTVHLVLSWPPVLNQYVYPWAWRLEAFPWRAALRIVSEEQYLTFHRPNYVAARTVETFVPPGEIVFSMGPVAEAYVNRTVWISTNSTPCLAIRDILLAPSLNYLLPQWSRDVTLEEPARVVRLLETTNDSVQRWSISEVSPRPLRIRTSSDPWTSHYAIDGNPYTQWIAGKPLSAGQWIELEYGHDVPSLRLWTAGTSGASALLVEGGGSVSNPLPDPRVPANTRRWAAETVRGLGVRYLLIGKDDYGFADFRDHTEAWNATLVAERGPYRLYKFN